MVSERVSDVNAALRAAHWRFVLLLVACGVGAVLCLPRWSDRDRVRSLELVDAVAAQLDRAALEKAIRARAEAGHTVLLTQAVGKIEGPGVRHLAAARGGAALFRSQPVRLDTLGDLAAHAVGGRPLKLVGPDLDSLATSLRWRLARLGGAEGSTLTALSSEAGSATAEQLAAERAVEPARLLAIDARRKYDSADTRSAALTERVKNLAKAHVARKTLWKVQEKRQEVLAERQSAEVVLTAAQDEYRRSAEAAAAFVPSKADAAAPGVVVVATFKSAEGVVTTWRLPSPRVDRTMPSEPVAAPPALSLLSASPQWSELADKSVEDAQSQVRARLSWHAQGKAWGPLWIGGSSFLQVLPLLLAVLLFVLSRACAEVQRVYHPFDYSVSPPVRIGTAMAALDHALVVGSVWLVVGLDVWTLLRIGAHWWIAFSLGVAACGYAIVVTQAWSQILAIRASLARKSMPPLQGFQ